ncbi:MAG TPA: hypothetical protein PLP57_00425 [Candidatus Saccharicenans sp.]|jgi:hypothetical protein|nr:hypothetical protein [Candidatus Saccharicenans sp.]HRD01097.1 hypothetical protein [Candidatus Saccharicenans sp.]
MEKKQPEYFVPALIGGALMGVASAIPFINCLCCLWAVAGAGLSFYFLNQKTAFPLKSSDGLLVGALAGVFGGLINALLEIPLSPLYIRIGHRFMSSASKFMKELPPGWEELLQINYQGLDFPSILLSLLLSCLFFAFFGALGGLVGYSLFKKEPPKEIKDETQLPQNPGDSQSSL